MRDIHLINPAAWTSAWLYCNNITIDGITIISRSNFNGDGLDFDGCQNVRVSNSNFDNSDDCICLQASLPNKPCKNVTITNCNFTTKWGGIRIGLLSRGDIGYVTVSNCTFKDIQDSGLKIQQNEGGEMSHMTFSNLVMENVPRPVFMTFCQQTASVDTPEGELEPLARMHHMKFDNIIVDNSKGDRHSAFFLTGIPNHEIENISITNVDFIVSGGVSKEDAKQKEVLEYTNENMKRWPEFYVVKSLPAYGIYARHIKGLNLENISISTNTEDKRMPIILDQVSNATTRNIKTNGKKVKVTKIK
jgi:polygalacturonase